MNRWEKLPSWVKNIGGASLAVVFLTLAVGLLVVMLGTLFLWPLLFARLYPSIEPYQGETWFQIVGTIACLLFSYAMFAFRETNRRTYGIVEIICAINLMWFGISQQKNAAVFGATILAGVYVAIRGFDNVKNGYEEQYQEKAVFRSKESHLDAIRLGLEDVKGWPETPLVNDIPMSLCPRKAIIQKLEIESIRGEPEYVVQFILEGSKDNEHHLF